MNVSHPQLFIGSTILLLLLLLYYKKPVEDEKPAIDNTQRLPVGYGHDDDSDSD